MKIEWNKVTWYSKILALVLFVALPFAGFYFGVQYGMAQQHATDASLKNASSSASVMIPQSENAYYKNVSEWQTNQNNSGWSIAYPLDFPTDDNHSASTTSDWSMNAFGTVGVKAFELDIPKAFEPQTNFDDAKLTIGRSDDATAVKECLSPSTEGPTSFGATTINGIEFLKATSSDAGAGNYYETTSYRALHAGQCWAVEYTIHSSQIANYPTEYQLRQFDETELTDVLDRIVETFKFE
jgi:hypothetical protein